MQLGIAGTAIGVSKLVASGFFEHLPARTSSRSWRRSAWSTSAWPDRRRHAPRPRRPLLVLRLGTALLIGVIGLVAWKAPWFELLEGVAMLTVAALAHAVLVARLRSRTDLVPAT